jgi:hypothetical protein
MSSERDYVRSVPDVSTLVWVDYLGKWDGIGFRFSEPCGPRPAGGNRRACHGLVEEILSASQEIGKDRVAVWMSEG